jgi:hypothetical protein
LDGVVVDIDVDGDLLLAVDDNFNEGSKHNFDDANKMVCSHGI